MERNVQERFLLIEENERKLMEDKERKNRLQELKLVKENLWKVWRKNEKEKTSSEEEKEIENLERKLKEIDKTLERVKR